ncbi:MAG TPA: imidazolonepropionase, partial [Clostridiales bacterium]|nr:imidazolonepropionase [Clostridiales bacterium]
MSRLIIKNASELVTCKGGPKHGKNMSEIGKIHDGCVVVEGGIITDVGTTDEVLLKYSTDDCKVIDASGRAVLPGFID